MYADSLIGGVGYAPGDVQTALRPLGARVFAETGPGGAAQIISPKIAPHRSLLGRLFGRLRKGR